MRFSHPANLVRLVLSGAYLLCGMLTPDLLSADPSEVAAEKYFQREVLPILKAHCFECHSHEAGEASGGLVLDSRRGWEVGGDSGPAVVPRDPEKSLLISAIGYETDLAMPPDAKLPDEVIAKIERWVASGAYDSRVTAAARNDGDIPAARGREHWAFQPRANATPPEVVDISWPIDELDRFVLAKLEERGLRPVEDADKYTWLRRVSFDLTGLPPTADEIRAFVADGSSDARGKVVDRLLDSHAFGERWARHWLDLVGYADQIGTSNKVFAQHAWRYRDYVIDALNDDKPYDRFIREQLAGDLLPYSSISERAANLVATGFLVLGDIEIVEADKAKLLIDIVDQQLNKTGTAFLAMTIDCARCHDHKFDPISQQDYYAMGGFFHNTSTVYKTNRGVWSDVHQLQLPETEEQRRDRERQVNEHQQGLHQLETRLASEEDRKIVLQKQLENPKLSQDDRKQREEELAATTRKISDLGRTIQHSKFFAPAAPLAHGVQEAEQVRNMRVTIRGNPRALGKEVPRGFLSVISTETVALPQDQSGRRELADWIADSEHPLTARVAVNRIWQKLFGEGLVRSVDYFGLPGERPSHPELLDFLANRFVRDGWSNKKLIRRLVLSRTYALSSAHDAHGHEVDPENRLLWRMNRVRLDAEALRDAMIAVSGSLQPCGGGPAMPLEYPENVAGLDPKDVNPPSFNLLKWRPEQEYQRTVYLPVIRYAPQAGPANLRNVFDFPQPSEFVGQRAVTAVPTQALFLMNSPEVKKYAADLAEFIRSSEAEDDRRLELLWLSVLNRPPTSGEQRAAVQFLGESADPWQNLCHGLLAANEFLMRI